VSRLVLVVGVGRSGTSLFAGIAGQLGLHIPQPEVKADDTNPRGFGEPRWVVDFHTRLMRERRVTVNDARPAAWESTGAAADDPEVVGELRDWLAGQFGPGTPDVLVKDPRTAWFLPLWTRCAADLGVDTSYVTMLRRPAETLASAFKSYGTWQSAASRAAAWLNVSLETERATRDALRAFVRYDDLLAAWRPEVTRAGEALRLDPLRTPDPERAARVDAFVDPSLHRNRTAWDEFDVPAPVRELADEVWLALQPLADPSPDVARTQRALDDARTRYQELYAEAEAIAQSSVTAAKRRRGPARKPPAAPPPPASLRVRVARRVPVRYRRAVKRALRRVRGA
jgi:hypothetical protein